MFIKRSVKSGFHSNRPLSRKQAVNAKMAVLKDFCVVDDKNKNSIRQLLEKAIDEHPKEDYERVLDRVAHVLIEKELDSVV